MPLSNPKFATRPPRNRANFGFAALGEIHATANHVYGITFPLAEKAVVKGASPHPFYKWAASERPLDVPRWNFHKYLIGRDGHLAAAFPSAVEPNDPRLIAAIEKQLTE